MDICFPELYFSILFYKLFLSLLRTTFTKLLLLYLLNGIQIYLTMLFYSLFRACKGSFALSFSYLFLAEMSPFPFFLKVLVINTFIWSSKQDHQQSAVSLCNIYSYKILIIRYYKDKKLKIMKVHISSNYLVILIHSKWWFK